MSSILAGWVAGWLHIYTVCMYLARRSRRFTAAARISRACVRCGGASGKFQRDCTDLVLARGAGMPAAADGEQ